MCLRLRSLFALLVRLMHPVLRMVAQPAHAPAVSASAASTPAVSAQTSSVAQAPGAKSVLLAKGGELLRSVPGSIRRLGTVRGFLKGLPLLTLAALIVLGAISFFGPAASASVENASVSRTVVVVKHGETLWDIAQAVDPQGDTRDTVVRIMELNSLTSTSVDAGQLSGNSSDSALSMDPRVVGFCMRLMS